MRLYLTPTNLSFGGVFGLVGLVMLLVACFLLLAGPTPGPAVPAVVEAAGERVDPANEHKVVHITAQATGTGPAQFGDYGVSTAGTALRLKRTVEMYQWQCQSTTALCQRVWSATFLKAYSRSHANPEQLPPDLTSMGLGIGSSEQGAPSVMLGAFVLPGEIVNRIKGWSPLPLDATSFQNSAVMRRLQSLPALKNAGRVVNGMLYIGADPAHPAVGDVRISFSQLPSTTISVVAEQRGPKLEPFGNPPSFFLNMGNVDLTGMMDEVDAATVKRQDKASSQILLLACMGGGLLLFGLLCFLIPPSDQNA